MRGILQISDPEFLGQKTVFLQMCVKPAGLVSAYRKINTVQFVSPCFTDLL